MVVALWSAKGGAGTTVVAGALAVLLARREGAALAVDLAGDLPTVLGVDADGPGVAEWLAAGDDVAVDALGRLEVTAADGLAILPRGQGRLAGGRGDVLMSVLAAEPRPVVVDCGTAPGAAAQAVAAAATVSLLVTRACYVALRHALTTPLRPSGIVLITEDGRSMGRRHVEDVVGAPVRAELRVDPAVARAVDAGLLSGRLPRPLQRALRAAA